MESGVEVFGARGGMGTVEGVKRPMWMACFWGVERVPGVVSVVFCWVWMNGWDREKEDVPSEERTILGET